MATDNGDLAATTIRGSAYSLAAATVTLVLGLGRSILLARLLLPEHFGTVALALLFIELVSQLRSVGLDLGLIHRQDVDDAFQKTYFTLRVGLDIVVFGLLLLAIPLIGLAYPHVPNLVNVLPILIFAYFLASLSQIQETLLRKRLAYSSIAVVDVAASVVMTVIAPYLAWQGWGIWALVAERVSGLGTRFLLTWLVFRPWWPRPGWDAHSARWLWRYSQPTWLATSLTYGLDRFDDFWIGTFLGNHPLGLYTKAYEYAHYPRRAFANPVTKVFFPIFARLQNDRTRLSRVFYRSTHVVIRTGFLSAGIFALIMPEFITFVIGEVWRPMLWTFRLMLIYTALDPFLVLVQDLLLAIGQPHPVKRARIVQTLFFLPGVILGAMLGGINGVAVAANIMLLIGFWQFYRPLRQAVDFSPMRLLVRPAAIFVVAWGLALWVESAVTAGVWQLLLLKSAAFLLPFGGFLLMTEKDHYISGLRLLWQIVRSRWRR